MNRLMVGLAVLAGCFEEADAQSGSGGAGVAPEVKKVKFAEKGFEEGTLNTYVKFGDGMELTLDLAGLSQEIQHRLMIHGALQKIGDSYAGAKGNYAEAQSSAKQIIEQLQAGEWRASAGEGEGKPRVGELAEAIARVKGVEVDAAKKAVEAMTDEQRKAVRAHPKVKAAIAALRAEKAQREAEKAETAPLAVAGL